MRRSDSAEFQFDGTFDIPSVRRDASALAVHADSGNLWTITDDQVRLVEFTKSGELLREVKLTGFDDAEGLCHVAGPRFLVAEEKAMRVTLIEVPPDGGKVKAHDGQRFQLDVKAKKNKGLEGISYDAATDTLFAIREDKPPTLYRIQPLLGGECSAALEVPLDLAGFDDLSDTYFDPTTGQLWLVSHESQVAAAYDAQGNRLLELVLKAGHHGLPEDVEQAEGIVLDREGTLYICSEPNRIYRFRPTRA